jgi:multiple antibiotic resistance protein
MLDTLIQVFAVMFSAVNPLSKIFYFTFLTAGETPQAKRRTATKACLVAFFILLGFILIGDKLLRFLGIQIAAVSIAGGVLLFIVSARLVMHGAGKNESSQDESSEDPAIFPLAMPLIAGPTSIVACLVLMGNASGDLKTQLGIIGILAMVILMTFLTLLVSDRITKLLGNAGIEIMTRIVGFLLASLAVQMTLDGLHRAGVLAGH